MTTLAASSSLSVSVSCAATASYSSCSSNSEESTLQALFAEQTAREMAEVVAWWKNKSEEKNDDGDDYTDNEYCGECIDVDPDGATADSEITGTPDADQEKDGEGNSPTRRMDVDQKHCLPNNSLLMDDDDENDDVSYQLFQQELLEYEASVSCSCPVLDETMEASSCSMSSSSSSSDQIKGVTPPSHVHVVRARPSSLADGADKATEVSIAHLQNTLGSSNTAHHDDDDCDISTLSMSPHHSPSKILRDNNEQHFKLHSVPLSPTLSSSSSSSDNDTVGWSNCSIILNICSKNDAWVPLERPRRRRLCRANRQLLFVIVAVGATTFVIGVTIGILMMTTSSANHHHHNRQIQEQLVVGLPPPAIISPEPYYRYRQCNDVNNSQNELLRFETNANPDNINSKVDRFLTKIKTLV